VIEWIALAASLAAVCAGVIILLRGQSLELESGPSLEYELRSASLRLVSLVVRELVRCSAMYVAIAALLLASMMAAVTASTAVVQQQLHFESPGVAGVAICSSLSPCLDPARYWRGADVAVVQVVKWVDIGSGVKVMPILARCLSRCASSSIDWCEPLCTASSGVLVLSSGLQRAARAVKPRVLGASSVVFENLTPLVRTMVAPSTPLSPSLGVVGGVTVFVRSPSSIAVAPLTRSALGELCRGGCSARCILISFGSYPPRSLASECVLVRYRDSVAIVTSGFRAPTPRSIASLALAIILAVVIASSACGGIAEKMRRFCSALVIQGVSIDTITVATSMGSLSLSLLALPLSFAAPYAILRSSVSAGVSVVTYLASSLALSYILSKRVSRSFRVQRGVATSIALEVAARRSLSDIARCIKRSLETDDNFALSEIEVLPLNGRMVLRLELVYRKAMAILVSVEVEMEVIDGRLRILYAYSDVWSFEEVGEVTKTVSSLAISRAVGTLWLCSES